MTDIKQDALQYVRDNDGATKFDFLEDFRPLGQGLLFALHGLIVERDDKSLALSSSGNAVLDREKAK